MSRAEGLMVLKVLVGVGGDSIGRGAGWIVVGISMQESGSHYLFDFENEQSDNWTIASTMFRCL